MTQPVEPWIVDAFKAGSSVSLKNCHAHLRIICIDAPGAFPVIGLDVCGRCFYFHANGINAHVIGYDLLPPRRKFDVCVLQHKMHNSIRAATWDDWQGFPQWEWKLLARATIEEGSGI